VTIKRTAMLFALTLLPSAAFIAAPASAADTMQPPATNPHVPSHKATRHVHTTAAHKQAVHHPTHTVTSHHTAPKKPVDHTLN
jgi:Spy/CpxP family protein refolding chaperone